MSRVNQVLNGNRGTPGFHFGEHTLNPTRVTSGQPKSSGCSVSKKKLGWHRKITFDEPVREMVDSDLAEMKREGALRNVPD